MPLQVLEPLRLNRGHPFDHINELRWKGRLDQPLFSSVIAAMPYVLEDLQEAGGQRIVELALFSAARRHELFDPLRERSRYPYWR